MISVSRDSVEAEVLEKAHRIHELRKGLSPAVSHLVKHGLFEANSDFIDWDKGLWDLHDWLMRERARLIDGESPVEVLERARAATAHLDGASERIEQFKARGWWADVSFNDAKD
ncbi:hypothetical protein RCO27_12250 [Sphingosinicella sp. LHD-64]|uniref:hypothetical protein n=1 Tax=Sphingosinicella sp. LHD-64 TaxID=3072139 RepID=UPI00280F5D23|nr:hypothetical protein [Sphingosinicella sp. LHD-64]MDQ8757000.1 hypothetical protein [Sphingosinicella sp. LHD-64]